MLYFPVWTDVVKSAALQNWAAVLWRIPQSRNAKNSDLAEYKIQGKATLLGTALLVRTF